MLRIISVGWEHVTAIVPILNGLLTSERLQPVLLKKLLPLCKYPGSEGCNLDGSTSAPQFPLSVSTYRQHTDGSPPNFTAPLVRHGIRALRQPKVLCFVAKIPAVLQILVLEQQFQFRLGDCHRVLNVVPYVVCGDEEVEDVINVETRVQPSVLAPSFLQHVSRGSEFEKCHT